MKHKVLFGVLALTLIAAACTADPGPDTTGPADGTPPTTSPPDTTPPPATIAPVTGQLAKADVPRATQTSVTTGELGDLVAGDTDFALDIFRIAAEAGENTLLSPYSIAAALTMTYAGGRGDTATEMRDTLSLGLPDGVIHAARNELDLQITTPVQAPPEDDRHPFTIEIANSLWGQQGYPFLDEFLVTLAENYDAGMNLVDFATAAEEARTTINTWVEEQTHGRIVDLIPEGVVNEMTRLVLVNAIWFKTNWAEEFDPDLTEDGSFFLLDGSEVTVPMMQGSIPGAYYRGDGYRAASLPYAGDASMMLIVPDQGRFQDVVAGLDTDELAEILEQGSSAELDLMMPKFEFTSEFGLKDALAELGMQLAFIPPSDEAGADFTGITGRRELFVQDVVHQAFISVDEQGTEAAAATAVVIGLTSAGPPLQELNVDRPFVFAIRHGSTGEILFLGQVTDPS